MERENEKIRRFLLGTSSEAEAEEIGLRLFGESAFDRQVSLAEEALVEDFLDDALGEAEKELFYRNFLTTPARVDLLKETARLRNFARAHRAAPASVENTEKKPPDFFARWRNFLSMNLRPVAAVLILLIAVGVAWRVFFYDAGLSEIEKSYAALNAGDLSSPAAAGDLPTRSLSPGTFRDAGGVLKMTTDEITADVLFRLALPAGTAPDARFDLELVRGEERVFRQTDLKSYQNPAGRELKVILPKSVLSKGSYRLNLTGGLSYGLTVE